MEQVLILSLVTASISFTVSESKLFEAMRWKVKARSHFLGELVSCGYCIGHWIAFVLVAIYRPKLLDSWWILDYFLTILVIAWLSGIQWAAMCVLLDKAGK